MNKQAPDFYMTSSEDHRLKPLRKCYSIKRFRAVRRDDYLLISVSPPLDCNAFGLTDIELNQLVIGTRHKGASLFPIRKWPVQVYVLHLLVENFTEYDTIPDDKLVLLGWAELYDSQLSIR